MYKLKDVLNVQLIESSIANVITEPVSIFNNYFNILLDENKTNKLSDLGEYLARQVLYTKFHTFMNCFINNTDPIGWLIDTFAHSMNTIVTYFSILCNHILRADDDKLNKNINEIYALPITSEGQIINRRTQYNSSVMARDKIIYYDRFLEKYINNILVSEIVHGLITIIN